VCDRLGRGLVECQIWDRAPGRGPAYASRRDWTTSLHSEGIAGSVKLTQPDPTPRHTPHKTIQFIAFDGCGLKEWLPPAGSTACSRRPRLQPGPSR